jgi:hypothetical protein
MDGFIGLKSYSDDSGTYNQEDRTWKVIRRLSQSRTKDFNTWTTREFSVMAIDKSFTGAHKTTMNAMVNKLQSVFFDLFLLENDPEIKEFTTEKDR